MCMYMQSMYLFVHIYVRKYILYRWYVHRTNLWATTLITSFLITPCLDARCSRNIVQLLRGAPSSNLEGTPFILDAFPWSTPVPTDKCRDRIRIKRKSFWSKIFPFYHLSVHYRQSPGPELNPRPKKDDLEVSETQA